jgi:hypothetical protein
LPAATYSQQTRFAFRDVVTCLTDTAGAVLTDPPHEEKLTGLTAGQLQALETLKRGPATLAEMTTDADDVAGLMGRLADDGWLSITVRDGGRDLYTIRPFTRSAPRPSTPLPW